MFYKTEELRQMLMNDPESYYNRALAFAKEELVKVGHPDAPINVPLTEACYHYLSTNEQGNPMVIGMPCWLYSIRPSEETRMFASFAIWTAVEDISMIQPEIEVIGFHSENERGERGSRMLFCKQEEFAPIRQILQIAPVKRTNHLSLVVDNVNTVEALAESLLPSIEITQDKLIDLLKQHISSSLMPASTVVKYTHRVPKAVKAEDDGHFLKILLEQERSGFFYRDALRRGEIYAVIAVSDYNFVVGLSSHFSIVTYQNGKYYDMGEKSFMVDRARLMEILQAL